MLSGDGSGGVVEGRFGPERAWRWRDWDFYR